MSTRNAIVLRTEQAADCGCNAEGGEVPPGDEQRAGFRALTLVRDLCTEAPLRGQLQAVVFDPLEIPEQRITEDRVNASREIVRRSPSGFWTRRAHQHDLVWRRHR